MVLGLFCMCATLAPTVFEASHKDRKSSTQRAETPASQKKKRRDGKKKNRKRAGMNAQKKKKSWEKHVRKKWALFSDMILRCAPSMNWKSTHPADHCFECYLLQSSSKKKSCALQVSVHHYFFWISLFVFWGRAFTIQDPQRKQEGVFCAPVVPSS